MTTNAQPYAGLFSQPRVEPSPHRGYAVRVQNYRAVITLASQAAGSTIRLFRLPTGVLPLRGWLHASATLGSATLAIGIAGATGKYRAAATFTAAETPTPFMLTGANLTSGQNVPLANSEEVIATTAVADLPASGTLVVDMEVAAP